MTAPHTPGQPDASPAGRFRLFSPILAGATLKERLIGCIGALIGICMTGVVSTLFFGTGAPLPYIVAPVGASAVLLFAVPASPLAQPWSIIGGNTLSALAGVTVAHFVTQPMLAIGLAVSLAILVMSLTRSLHPPGGAAALTAVIGGAAVAKAGFLFPFIPVGLNSLLLVLLGMGFHRLSGRHYPQRPLPPAVNTHRTTDAPAALRVGFNSEDIDRALETLHETLDVSRDDIEVLLRQVELQSLIRERGEMLCMDIMSKDVITVASDASPAQARRLLLDHDIRTLPVLGPDGRLAGTVGLRELTADPDGVLPVSPAVTARPGDPAIGLLPKLTDGRTHAVVMVDGSSSVVGIVSQTDLLATLGRSLVSGK